MIELDREEAHNETIRQAGVTPIGERAGLVWFFDPATQSTLVLEPENVTGYNVILKVAKLRLTFAQKGMISRFYRTIGPVHHGHP